MTHFYTETKTFIVKYSQGKMLFGELKDPNGYTIPAMGFLLDNAAETAMKDLQELIPTSRCYIRPDWVQNGLAIFRRAKQWNAYTHLKDNVAVNLVVPLRQPSEAQSGPLPQPRRVWTTSSKVNDMIRELFLFFLNLHDQGFALDDFQPTDFVVVQNDHVPKLWRTELVSGPLFEKYRRRNFIHLGSFLKDYLELHFSMNSEHPKLPSDMENFLNMLMQGEGKTTDEFEEHVENLKVHVQVIAFEIRIQAFKPISEWPGGIIELLKRDKPDSMDFRLPKFDEYATFRA